MNQKKNIKIKTLLLVLTCFLSGCATIISGAESNVKIDSYPARSFVTVTSTSGKVFYHGETPSSIKLPKGDGYFNGAIYYVSYKFDGYQDATSRINSSLNPLYLLNIFNVIGFFIVDPMSGAMWNLEERTEQVLRKRE